ALGVPVAVGKYFRIGIVPACKRVVVGYAAIIMQTEGLSIVGIEELGLFTFTPVADGEVQVPVVIESNAASKMVRSAGVGRSPENDFVVCQRIVLKPGPHNGGMGTLATRFAVRQVYPARIRKIGVKDDIKQAT